MSRWIGASGWAAVLSLSGVPQLGWGQQSLDVTRRELMQQAQAEALAGHPVQALDLASRAGQIQMTPSLRSFIAQQQLANHLPLEATASGQVCVREATGEATLRNREAILAACQEVVATAQSQLGHVNVHLDPTHASVQVRVAGTVLNDAVLGVPVAVDPGDVVIETSGGGFETQRTTVHVEPGHTHDVRLTLRASAVAPASPAPETRRVTSTTSPERTTRSGPPPATVALWIGGGAALIVGGVFAGLYAHAVGRLENSANCVPDGMFYDCYPSASGLRSDGELFGNVSLVAFGVGIVAAAAGVAWWAAAPRHQEAPRVQAFVTPTAGGALVGAGGAW